jgi:hypothetical protein
VKTLVIRSTAEQAMINRKNALKSTSGKLPNIEQEVGMRGFIAVCSYEPLCPAHADYGMQNPKFLQASKDAYLPTLSTPLIDLTDVGADEISVVHVSHKPQLHSQKKGKKVQFLDDEGSPSDSEGSSHADPATYGDVVMRENRPKSASAQAAEFSHPPPPIFIPRHDGDVVVSRVDDDALMAVPSKKRRVVRFKEDW